MNYAKVVNSKRCHRYFKIGQDRGYETKYIEVFDFALTDEGMKKIATLDTTKSTIHDSPKKVRNCKMDCDIQDGRKINMNS